MIATRVISLDLDDTLWPVGPVIMAAEEALLEWLRRHHPQAMRGHDVDTMRALRARVALRFPERGHDLTFLRRSALALQFAAAGYRGSAAADEAFEVFLAARNRVRCYEDVKPALKRLGARYRLFAVSNGNADVGRCGLGEYFEGHVTAAAAGAAKPDPRIFAHLLRACGVPAAAVLHIGDDPRADVVGALGAGMQAVWLNRENRPWPSELPQAPRTVTTLADVD
jgi:putative hydrolase of the HAD superfamily